MQKPDDPEQDQWRALHAAERKLETPMVVLGLIWLILLIVELVYRLPPLLVGLGTVIWIIFIADFVLRLTLAPAKTDYLKNNWLTLAALLVPALRVFRVFRAVRLLQTLRVTRGVRLLRVVTSFNRAMRSLALSLGRHGFGYAAALTVVVLLTGAAGMYAFEGIAAGGTLDSYGEAVWWTGMVITTLGSDYWPVTIEGRVLCLLLSIYAMAVFGYVAATLASFFIERSPTAAMTAGTEGISALRDEIAALRAEVRALRRD